MFGLAEPRPVLSEPEAINSAMSYIWFHSIDEVVSKSQVVKSGTPFKIQSFHDLYVGPWTTTIR